MLNINIYNFVNKINWLYLAIVFFVFTSTASHAQVVTKSSTGRATVIRGISVSLVGNNSLDFGEVVVTSAIQYVTISNQNGQKFLVRGERNRSVVITYPTLVTMTNSAWVAQNGGTTSTLTFISSTLKRTGTNSNYQNAQNVTSGSSVSLPNSNGIGTLYLWAGGSIIINSNKPHGIYEGPFVLSISY